jgi:hypothetical protein
VQPRAKEVDEAETPVKEMPTYAALAASWIVSGNPFIRVEVSDMGLVEARAIWTAATLQPSDGQAILDALRRVLLSLDESMHT